jgi:hypothetical protein
MKNFLEVAVILLRCELFCARGKFASNKTRFSGEDFMGKHQAQPSVRGRKTLGAALLAGGMLLAAPAVGAVGLLVGTPTAVADDQDCTQQPPDQQQQCQQQKKGSGMPDLPTNNINPQQQDVSKKPMSQVGYMYIINGVPTCMHNWDVLIGGTFVPVTPAQAC